MIYNNDNISDKMAEIIKVNVGGKLYDITKNTLVKIPYFVDMIKDCNDNQIIFVERSSLVFDHVLAYVIDNNHPYPLDLCYELYFYGVSYHKSDIFRVNISEKIFEVKLTTLLKIPYFKPILNNIEMNNANVIYVERSPAIFKHVLNYILDSNYLFPIEYQQELDYYEIEYNKLFDKDQDLREQLDVIENIGKNEKFNYEDILEKIGKTSYQCWITGCNTTRQKKKLFCLVHINDSRCATEKCNNKASKTNYCQSCIVRPDSFICNSKNCGLIRIKNKDYCCDHNK